MATEFTLYFVETMDGGEVSPVQSEKFEADDINDAIYQSKNKLISSRGKIFYPLRLESRSATVVFTHQLPEQIKRVCEEHFQHLDQPKGQTN